MVGIFINLAEENLQNEHLCCAISDKKHQCGVDFKRAWLTEFNNWAVFHKGKFVTHHLLNEGYLKKMLDV